MGLFKQEILCTYDLDVYDRAKNILSENDIPFTFKTVNQKSPSAISGRSSHSSSLGINMKYNYLYYIYVDKKNFANAKRILDRESVR